MNALNEVHKLLPSLSPIHHRPSFNRSDDNEGLTPEKFIVRKNYFPSFCIEFLFT